LDNPNPENKMEMERYFGDTDKAEIDDFAPTSSENEKKGKHKPALMIIQNSLKTRRRSRRLKLKFI
jgi:hypothetical protein